MLKHTPVADAGAIATATTACGDVNGDGTIDLADPICLLTWMFLGNCDLRCRTGPLPATGQAICFDNTANQDCSESLFPDQDGDIQSGCPMADRFVDNGDGTISDVCTGLMWAKGTMDRDGNGVIGAGDRLSWQNALNYCRDLVLCDKMKRNVRNPSQTHQTHHQRLNTGIGDYQA